ncbi:protein CDV3 homolog isoform X2 [Corythoichthys intestinalis]|uniref:protein CDV3 homolog isoform X2 n=1 Tax=Corythoichthys intestinalis TaxID=161448 RepID=UPI0025A635F5|nr:protein CDV3 homolog isoform X2 [Corythoichthys intestinalis]
MADVSSEKSLDDFFAKRDKKKKKDKGKAKESSSSSTGLKKSKKENEKSSKGDGSDPNMDKDEEWKEFEQKEVDYSGLRLQAMQISDEKDEEEYEDDEQDEDGDGDVLIVAGGDKVSGPWNKSTSAPAPAPPVEDVEAPESKPSGVYRPPGARYTSSRRGHNQGPPEIFSDAQFPSLMATGKHVETRKDREMEKTFEVVKHKGRGREDGNTGAAVQHLQLDNQYAVLGDK